MTVSAVLLLGIVAAVALAAVLARTPRSSAGSEPEPPEVRELRGLREDLASAEISPDEYERGRERIAERLAASELVPTSRARRSWRWAAAGVVGSAIVVATLPGALRQRGANDYPTGNDFVAAESAAKSGMEEWRRAERRRAAGDEGGAVDHYRRAVAFMPERQELRARFGFALAAAGRLDEAVAQLRMAVREAPREPDARLYLGGVLLRAGRRAEAARQWRHFLALEPRGARARIVRRLLVRSSGSEQDMTRRDRR